MSAYVIATYDIVDPNEYQGYVPGILRLLQKHGAEILAADFGAEALEGQARGVNVVLRGAALVALQRAGYTHRGEQGIPGRDFLRRGEPRQYHIHLTVVGSTFWHDHRDFRNWLRSHPGVAADYAALKQQLAARYPADREAYIEGKTAFVESVLQAARADASRRVEADEHAMVRGRDAAALCDVLAGYAMAFGGARHCDRAGRRYIEHQCA